MSAACLLALLRSLSTTSHSGVSYHSVRCGQPTARAHSALPTGRLTTTNLPPCSCSRRAEAILFLFLFIFQLCEAMQCAACRRRAKKNAAKAEAQKKKDEGAPWGLRVGEPARAPARSVRERAVHP